MLFCLRQPRAAAYFGGVLFAAAALLLFARCFTPSYADCAFRCGGGEPACPAEYECRSDGYCHLPDSTMVCAAATLDLAGLKLGGSDLGAPDLTADDL